MNQNNFKQRLSAEAIDALLPQTQCGLCGYNGCQPYAEAIANDGERIDLCLPGGVETLNQLGSQLGQDTAPMKQEMAEKAKPPMKAIIREDECIGCTKCLQACPVDAILGGPKRMHTVIEQECTGCELCVEPCPVDCIDMVEIAEMTAKDRQWQADNARQRYQARQKRLDKRHKRQQKQHQQAKLGENKRNKTLSARKEAIQAAVARAKAKKRNN